MSTAFTSPPTPFAFDQLVSEVNTIVEDLRWLHVEMSLRNYCNELVFRGLTSEESFLRQAFAGLREKLGAFEVTVYTRTRLGVSAVFRDVDSFAPWKTDHTPWMEAVDAWFLRRPSAETYAQPELTHCLSGRSAITAITTGIVVGGDFNAVIVVIAPASNIILRLKKLLVGLANTVGLCLTFLSRSMPEETLPFDATLAAQDLPLPLDTPENSLPLPLPDTDRTTWDAPSEGEEVLTPSDDLRDHYTRLAKQYRFLMKHAPFAVLHLDEERDVIRNANPAFERLIGTDQWDGMSLSDFAVLETLPGFGDTLPCVLHILSASGITVTYRGIITRMHMYQTTIRELTLDTM